MSNVQPNLSYQAIARRFRPSRFEDLVGQEHVVQTLRNAILKNRVAHAYLFSGARGIGKTSVARIFAKALRCPNATDAMPCNECPECQLITDSRSVDVVEIDGASNNGVEAVRGIRENVAYGASSGKYKIYIIDEVHMLSISAFNALLKTLEEPPPHVIFLFATTEVQKIPLTILSRCQRFEFKRLTNTQIAGRLKQILEKEKNQVTEEALRTIASHADGSLRDALSLLEQVLSYFGGLGETTIDESQIGEALGTAEASSLQKLLGAILQKDLATALKIIGDTYLAGVDLKHFSERGLEELRLFYLVKLSEENKQGLTDAQLDISSAHFNFLKEETARASLLQLERMSQILVKCISQLGWVSSPRFLLEMAVVRMAQLDGLSQIEKAFLEGGRPSSDAGGVSKPRPVEDDYQEPTAPQAAPPPPPPPMGATAMAPSPPSRPMPVPPPRGEQSWKGFVDYVMKKRPLLGALLSHANFRMEGQGDSKNVHLAFPPGSFYEKQMEDNKNRSEISDNIKAFFGPTAQMKLSNDMQNTAISIEESKRLEIEKTKQEAMGDPVVQQVKNVLGADIVDIQVEGA